jgi:sec-independent protein translocase protein TatA
MGMPGISELMVIFAVLVLLFGGKKLPELGGALGESIRNFRKGVKGEGEGEGDATPSLPKTEAAHPTAAPGAPNAKDEARTP